MNCPKCGGWMALESALLIGERDTVACANCSYSPPPSAAELADMRASRRTRRPVSHGAVL